ncbi:hypothetical protein IC789_09075 [Acinetobacter seifertii]|uniref:Uncharacterized protein n=1 Tax=Acinetobacter seifertii TaxID=1530123 RepID=A0A7H2Q6H8_9GAMM|nr:hypothetical protein [Acinetobacter seifertii]RQL45626.1 hypothetical protein BJI61_04950 [Acinetobacter baumannii]MBD1220207.1 hypothetical protein [Acinetobacter seifertii]MBD1224950.1 hypothetical protein [Acinetobacter seifertii]MBD1225938.1 hypothetical protein [Acinetobacter seifertii]MBD1229780.1 hypothetical protein [Acinetobacter seifertii]
MTLSLEERIKLFGSPIPQGINLRVVESGTVVEGRSVTDTNVVLKDSDLFLTQKIFEKLKESCKEIL